jgi:rod shape-determining protein MreC
MRDTRRTRAILVALLLVSLTLIALGSTSGPGHALRTVAGDVFGPVQRAVSAVWRPVRGMFGGNDPSSSAQVQQLEKQNQQLQQQLKAIGYSQARANELSSLLKVASLGQYRITLAEIIATGSNQTFSKTAEIDAGARDGLKVGMTVINGQGLVGRLVTVAPTVSTLVLATDPSFQVGARLDSNLEVGRVLGEGDDPMQFQLFNAQAVMKPGNRTVTRQDSFYPGGIPIGTLTSVTGTVGSQSRFATLQPFVNFSSLDLVGVIVEPPRTDPRLSVLPAKPAPVITFKACPTPTTPPTPSTGGTTSPSTGPSSGATTSSPPSTGTLPNASPSPCISYPPGYRGPRP